MDLSYFENVEVIIKNLSNNQHHISVGDGIEHFLGKKAIIKSIDTLNNKIYVQIIGFDYILWFIPDDLEIIKQTNN